MNRTVKILLGVITCFPSIASVFLVSHLFSLLFETFHDFQQGYEYHPPPDPVHLFTEYFYLIGILGLISVVSVFLLVLYIIHIARNKKLNPGSQVLWILLIFFFNGIANIFYWYIYIWNVQDHESV